MTIANPPPGGKALSWSRSTMAEGMLRMFTLPTS